MRYKNHKGIQVQTFKQNPYMSQNEELSKAAYQ